MEFSESKTHCLLGTLQGAPGNGGQEKHIQDPGIAHRATLKCDGSPRHFQRWEEAMGPPSPAFLHPPNLQDPR